AAAKPPAQKRRKRKEAASFWGAGHFPFRIQFVQWPLLLILRCSPARRRLFRPPKFAPTVPAGVFFSACSWYTISQYESPIPRPAGQKGEMYKMDQKFMQLYADFIVKVGVNVQPRQNF